MFAYCNNNPGIFLDSEGEFALAISVIAWLFVDLVISFGFIIQLIEIYEENSRSINALKNAHEEDSDSDESSQVEDAGVSAPATPPNGNKRNNKNNGGKDFNKIKNNREANKLAQKFGYKNAESFKREFVFNDGVHFNIALNKSTGEIILVSIYNSKIVINTGFFYR